MQKMTWLEILEQREAFGGNPLIIAKVHALMAGYDAHWRGQDWRSVLDGIEKQLVVPLINPVTGAASRTYQFAAKLDGIVAYEGNPYLREGKTTSQEIADPAAPFWRQLAIDSQVSSYMLVRWLRGEKLKGTLYDVVRKPTIRPKAIPKKSKEGIGDQAEMLHGTYYGMMHCLPIDSLPENETPSLYSLRLQRDCIDNPDRYYQRRVINRLDSEVAEYAQELWELATVIREARNRQACYRNSVACVQYSTPCQYLSLCSGADTPDSDNWQSRPVHAELDGDLGQETLTNSRIKTFQTCRRLHYWRYERCIERADVEEKEAFYFGSLWHECQAAWWNDYQAKIPSSDGQPVWKENIEW